MSSALGLLRGTSSLVCIAESGGPPLHILALQRLQRYFTRLRYNFPNHPLLFLLATNQGRLADLYRQTTPLFTLPVSPSSLLLSVTPPWQIHTTSNLSIPRVNKKALTTPTVCRALVNEHLHRRLSGIWQCCCCGLLPSFRSLRGTPSPLRLFLDHCRACRHTPGRHHHTTQRRWSAYLLR